MTKKTSKKCPAKPSIDLFQELVMDLEEAGISYGRMLFHDELVFHRKTEIAQLNLEKASRKLIRALEVLYIND
jgi:hypothetical protein